MDVMSSGRGMYKLRGWDGQLLEESEGVGGEGREAGGCGV